MADPIQISAHRVDMSTRVGVSTVVAASPSGSSETVIATLTGLGYPSIVIETGVIVMGWAAFTVGTSGVSVNLKLYDTALATGELLAATGALSVTAGNLYAFSVHGVDVEADQTAYCLTMTVGSGAAASTVSAVCLRAIAV